MLGDALAMTHASEASFLRELLRQFRANQGGSAWDGKSDEELLAPLLIARERRRDPVPDDPDPDVFFRIELFYGAVGLAIEGRRGIVCTPMLKMHHEGFGRVVLLAGRLVVVNRFLREARKFGFESIEKLTDAGERLVASGVEMIDRFPEVARHRG
jgi:probable nitrogen fixation protein